QRPGPVDQPGHRKSARWRDHRAVRARQRIDVHRSSTAARTGRNRMMGLDIATVSAMTAVVVITAGIVFILETVFREDDSVSRIWSLGFLAGILASVSYTIWAVAPDSWGAVAIGNAAFVASAGFMWLGCRRFNNRAQGWAEIAVGVFTVAAGVAVVVEGSGGGSWAGAEVMFLALCVLPAASALETARGGFSGIRTSVGLA